MGHHDRHLGRYFFNGWMDQGFSMDLSFHIFEVLHQGLDDATDPTARIWNDGNPGSYRAGSQKDLIIGTFCRAYLMLGAWKNNNQLSEFSNCQVGEFLLFQGEIEESDRLLVEGYLGHKWGIALPSSHPWSAESPSFGEIVTEGVTPVGFTGPTSSPIAINLGPANLRQSTASLTGQLINPGRAYSNPENFLHRITQGLSYGWIPVQPMVWSTTPILFLIQSLTPSVVQEVVFHLDANDSDSITLSDDDVAEWIDKSGNGYDMVAQGHPRLVDYGYGTDLKVVHFESDGAKAGGDPYSQKSWDTSTGDLYNVCGCPLRQR